MSHRISITARAAHDIEQIYRWLDQRSPEGARRWYDVCMRSAQGLAQSSRAGSVALEAEELGIDLRERLFKTRRGQTYRILYLIKGDVIHVLAVRGAGQNDVTASDLL